MREDSATAEDPAAGAVPDPVAAPPGPPTFKSDSIHAADVGRATAIITIARGVQMFSFLALGAYLPRRLDSPSYGTYQFIPFLAQAIPMAFAVPIAKAITYFVPRTKNPEPLLRASALALAAAGLVAALVLGLSPAAMRLIGGDNEILVSVRVLAAAIVGFSFAQSVGDYVLIVRGRRMLVAKVMLFQSVWNVLAIGGAAVFAPAPLRLEYTLLGLLGSTAIPALIAFWWLLAPMDPPATGRGPTRSDVFRYTLPLAGAVAVSYLATAIDKLLVPHLFPMAENHEALDLYLRAAMDVPLLGAVAYTLFGLVAPRLAELHGRGDIAGALALWRRSCRQIAIATVPIAGLLCAVAGEAFTLVYGQRYEPAVPIFRWYLLRIVLAVFVPQILLESVGATVRSFAFAAVAVVLAAGFTALLVPWFHLQGLAAAAILASIAANWGFGTWLLKSHLHVPGGHLLDWGHFLRLLATCGGAALVSIYGIAALPRGAAGDGSTVAAWFAGAGTDAFATAANIASHLQAGLLHGAAYAAAFVVLARVLRSVSREDLEMLRGLVKRRRSAA